MQTETSLVAGTTPVASKDIGIVNDQEKSIPGSEGDTEGNAGVEQEIDDDPWAATIPELRDDQKWSGELKYHGEQMVNAIYII